MTVIEAAYDLLVILTLADGAFDPNEARVIAEFLADNADGSFEPHAANERLMALKPEHIDGLFDEAASVVKAGTANGDREAILEFGIDLIMSDGELSEEENALIQRLSASWEVPLQPLVARAMGLE